MSTLDLTANIIDVRDIIERFEELETSLLEAFNEQQELEDGEDAHQATEYDDALFREWLKVTVHDDAEEFQQLLSILEELKGYGGDEQWRGDWYPLLLIADEYFTEYAEELVKDCEGLPREIPSYIEIDWEATADNIKIDYSTVEIDGNEYWYR